MKKKRNKFFKTKQNKQTKKRICLKCRRPGSIPGSERSLGGWGGGEMTTHSSILAQRIPWTEATVHGVAWTVVGHD